MNKKFTSSYGLGFSDFFRHNILKILFLSKYEKKIYSTPSGTPVGRISAWGVMDVELSEYEGYPCLVALQMVEGSDKFDIWGCVDIYFDYDINGKIRVLDLKFRY